MTHYLMQHPGYKMTPSSRTSPSINYHGTIAMIINMIALRLAQWLPLCLLVHINLVMSQNITMLVHFGSGPAPASVVSSDSIATTYLATYTNRCHSGQCSQLTTYTNVMVQAQSTAP